MGGMSGVNNYGAGYFQTYGRNRSIDIILLLILVSPNKHTAILPYLKGNSNLAKTRQPNSILN